MACLLNPKSAEASRQQESHGPQKGFGDTVTEETGAVGKASLAYPFPSLFLHVCSLALARLSSDLLGLQSGTPFPTPGATHSSRLGGSPGRGTHR